MRLVALVRAVWDPRTVKISRTRGILDTRRSRRFLNPTDRSALEVALAWKDETGVEVVALGWGGEAGHDAVREAVATGADSGLLVEADEAEPLDPWSHLDPVIYGLQSLGGFELISVGHRRAGHGVSLLGPRLAEQLEMPMISRVSRIVVGDSKVTAEAHGVRPVRVEVPLPCLVTVDANVASRFPTMSGVFLAFEEGKLRRLPWDGRATAEGSGSVAVRETAAESPEPVCLEGGAGEVARSLLKLLSSRGMVLDP